MLPGVAAAAGERGQAWDLEATMAELMVQLEGWKMSSYYTVPGVDTGVPSTANSAGVRGNVRLLRVVAVIQPAVGSSIPVKQINFKRDDGQACSSG